MKQATCPRCGNTFAVLSTQELKQQSNQALREGKINKAVQLYNKAWERQTKIKKGTDNG